MSYLMQKNSRKIFYSKCIIKQYSLIVFPCFHMIYLNPVSCEGYINCRNFSLLDPLVFFARLLYLDINVLIIISTYKRVKSSLYLVFMF